MKIINQGKPNSSYFCVAALIDDVFKQYEAVKCINPRTGISINGTFIDQFMYSWTDIPDSFSLLNFGMTTADYRKAISEAKPEFRNTEIIKILIILETK